MDNLNARPEKKITAALQALMSAIYMGCGLFLIFSDKGKLLMPADFLPYTSVALLVYGLFRAFRAWNQIRNARI